MDKAEMREKLQQELVNAIEQGRLPHEALTFLEDRSVHIGETLRESVVVTGDLNQITVNYMEDIRRDDQQDEHEKLKIALNSYRQHWQNLLTQPAARLYPGLPAYQLSDAPNFFGREAILAELWPVIAGAQILWLHGRSGVGKSSLIQAGLIPKLLLGAQAFVVLVRLFDRQPGIALQREILKSAWSEELTLAKMELAPFLRSVSECLGTATPIWVIFDQFEEFFFQPSETTQTGFAEQLRLCLNDPGLDLHFIFSLRSDYYGETSLLRKRLPEDAYQEYYLRALKHDEARQVIQGPLGRQGIQCPTTLVETILADLGEDNYQSPQLQLVCEKLYQSLPEGAMEVTLENYRQLGGACGIVDNYVRQVLSAPTDIPPGHYKAACYLLSTLVTPEGRKDHKQVTEWYNDERIRRLVLPWVAGQKGIPLSDPGLGNQALRHLAVAEYVAQIGPHVSIPLADLQQLATELSPTITDAYLFIQQKTFVNELVQMLHKLRLISATRTEDGLPAYELAHDYLLPEVGKLLDVEELEARRLQRMLAQKQLEFADHAFLLERRELELIFSQVDNPKLILPEAEKRLILLSATQSGLGRQGLAMAGAKGMAWLRNAYQDPHLPETVCLGAAGCLGDQGDEQALEDLVSAQTATTKHPPVTSLAHYLHRAATRPEGPDPRLSAKTAALPWQVRRAVTLPIMKLRVQDGQAERGRARRIAVIAAPICIALLFLLLYFQDILLDPQDFGATTATYLGTGVIFTIIGAVGGLFFAEITTIVHLITRRWMWIWRTIVSTIAGCLGGSILFFALGGSLSLCFLGCIPGMALAFNIRQSPRYFWWQIGIAGMAGLLTAGVSLVILLPIGRSSPIGSAISIGVFSFLYLYFRQTTSSDKHSMQS